MVGKNQYDTNSIKKFLSLLVHERVVTIFLLGFSIYSAYFIIFTNIEEIIEQAHLNYDNITMIMMYPLIIYAFRFIFAPLVDRVQLPFLTFTLGRRRSWLIFSQICTFVIILVLAIINPENYFKIFSFFSIILTIFISINFILVDAIRIESGFKNLQPIMIFAFALGCQLSIYTCNFIFELIDSYVEGYGDYDFKVWSIYFIFISIIVAIGVFITIYIKDPENDENLNLLKYTKYDYYKTLFLYILCIAMFFFIYKFLSEKSIDTIKDTLVSYGLSASFVDNLKNIFSFIVALIFAIITFYCIDYLKIIPQKLCASISTNYLSDLSVKFKRNFVSIIILVVIYRIPEITGNFICDSFFSDKDYNIEDLDYFKDNIMPIAKIIGYFIAGFIALRIGIIKTLTYGAISSLIGVVFIFCSLNSNLGINYLYVVNSFQYVFFGFSEAIFIGIISIIVSRAYSATQFVILYIASSIIAKVLNPYASNLINTDALGHVEVLFLLIIFSAAIIVLSNKVQNMLIKKFNMSAKV